MISTASVVLAVLVVVGEVSAHGVVSQIQFGDNLVDAWAPYTDPYRSPKPVKLTREFNSNSPVVATDAAILCNTNGGTSNVPSSFTQTGVTAGEDMKFFWTEWPESHKGPAMTYMANCNGDCSTFDATGEVWFKIDESGLNDGVWASDALIANNNTYTTKIPSTIAPGSYLIRHELLALHSAGEVGGAQFYPACHQVEVASSGTLKPTELVAFPGAYGASDPGVKVNIYTDLTSYTIPGPAVIEGGTSGGSASTGSSTTAAAGDSTSSSSSTGDAAEDSASSDSSTGAAAGGSSGGSSSSSSEATAASTPSVKSAAAAAATTTPAATSASSSTTSSSSSAAGTSVSTTSTSSPATGTASSDRSTRSGSSRNSGKYSNGNSNDRHTRVAFAKTFSTAFTVGGAEATPTASGSCVRRRKARL